jgi:hypothetical protein
MVEETQIHRVNEYEDLLEVNQDQGQDRLIRKNLNSRLRPYYIVTGFLFSIFLLEIFRWLADAPPLPIVVLGLFLISLGISFYQLRDVRDRINFLNLGKQGEPDAASVLDEFHIDNANILHQDVVIGDDFIDFVLIDHAGIVLINILELQVPMNREAVISYSDNQVYLNGYRPEENPLEVLRSAQKSLGSNLYAAIGKSVPIESIVIFPKWFVEVPKEHCNAKIINPRNLLEVLQKRKALLSDNDASLLKHHTTRLFKKIKQQ